MPLNEPEQTTEATPGHVASTDQLGPVAEVKCGRLQWAIPRDDYRLPLRFLNNDTHPLYDQTALNAAVAAERERLLARAHSLAEHERGAIAHHAGKWHAAYEHHLTRHSVMADLIGTIFGPNVL